MDGKEQKNKSHAAEWIRYRTAEIIIDSRFLVVVVVDGVISYHVSQTDPDLEEQVT